MPKKKEKQVEKPQERGRAFFIFLFFFSFDFFGQVVVYLKSFSFQCSVFVLSPT